MIFMEIHIEMINLCDTTNPLYLSLIGARIIGRKMKIILSGKDMLINRVSTTLRKRPTEEWNAMLEGFLE